MEILCSFLIFFIYSKSCLAIQLVCGTSVVLLKCLLVPEIRQAQRGTLSLPQPEAAGKLPYDFNSVGETKKQAEHTGRHLERVQLY